MKKKAVKKILVVFMAMVLSFSFGTDAYAQSTQDKLNQKENERNETQQEKNEAEEKLKTQIGEQKTLQGTLSALNQELTKVSENLAVIEGDILTKEEEIEVTRAELDNAEKQRDEQDYAMKKRIQFMYAGKLLNIRLKYYGENPEPILDRLPTARVVEQYEQECVIEAEVYGKGCLMWLLSQGNNVEILQPESLREEMKKTLLKMLERYQ